MAFATFAARGLPYVHLLYGIKSTLVCEKQQPRPEWLGSCMLTREEAALLEGAANEHETGPLVCQSGIEAEAKRSLTKCLYLRDMSPRLA